MRSLCSAGKAGICLLNLCLQALSHAAPVDIPRMIREMANVKEKILAAGLSATITQEQRDIRQQFDPKTRKMTPREVAGMVDITWASKGEKWFVKLPTDERGRAWDGFRLLDGSIQQGKFFATVNTTAWRGRSEREDPVYIGYFADLGGVEEHWPDLRKQLSVWMVDLLPLGKPIATTTKEGLVQVALQVKANGSTKHWDFTLDPQHDWIIRRYRSWLVRSSSPRRSITADVRVSSLTNHKGLWLPKTFEIYSTGLGPDRPSRKATVAYSEEVPDDTIFNILKPGDEVYYVMGSQTDRMVVKESGQLEKSSLAKSAAELGAESDTKEYLLWVGVVACVIAAIAIAFGRSQKKKRS